MIVRRSVILGLGSLLAAPALARASSLMRVRSFGPKAIILADGFVAANGAELSCVDYPELFRAYGFRFGGDGRSRFGIPTAPTLAINTTANDRHQNYRTVGLGVTVGSDVPMPNHIADPTIEHYEGLEPFQSWDGNTYLKTVMKSRVIRPGQEHLIWNENARLMKMRSAYADLFRPKPISILDDIVYQRTAA